MYQPCETATFSWHHWYTTMVMVQVDVHDQCPLPRCPLNVLSASDRQTDTHSLIHPSLLRLCTCTGATSRAVLLSPSKQPDNKTTLPNLDRKQSNASNALPWLQASQAQQTQQAPPFTLHIMRYPAKVPTGIQLPPLDNLDNRPGVL